MSSYYTPCWEILFRVFEIVIIAVSECFLDFFILLRLVFLDSERLSRMKEVDLVNAEKCTKSISCVNWQPVFKVSKFLFFFKLGLFVLGK